MSRQDKWSLVIVTCYLILAEVCYFACHTFGKFPACQLDSIVAIMKPGPYFWTMVIAVGICSMWLLKQDSNYSFLLKRGGRRQMLFNQWKRNVFVAVWLSSVLVIGTMFFYSDLRLNNWDVMDSVYYTQTGLTTEQNTVLLFVVLWLINIFRCFVMQGVLTLVWWSGYNLLIVILPLCAVSVFEMIFYNPAIFLRRFTLDYPVWIHKNLLGNMALYGAIWLLVLVVLSFVVSCKREFYGNEA